LTKPDYGFVNLVMVVGRDGGIPFSGWGPSVGAGDLADALHLHSLQLFKSTISAI
jgi:hypothetical protein